MKRRKPGDLEIDIETTHFNADIGVMLAFGYKWRGTRGAPEVLCLHDFRGFRRCPWDDSALVRAAFKIMARADRLVFHYGDDFDLPFFKARLLRLGLYFPKIPSLDTCKIARRHLRMPARLEALAEHLGLGSKLRVPKSVWQRAGFGHIPSLELLRRRCEGDVRLLGRLVEKLQPYIAETSSTCPGRGRKDIVCDGCGSASFRRKERKYYAAERGFRQTYQCLECGRCCKGENVVMTDMS